MIQNCKIYNSDEYADNKAPCKFCDDGYYQEEKENAFPICVKMPDFCIHTNNDDFDPCIECFPGFKLDDNNECVEVFNEHCKTINANTNTCELCEDDYYLYKDPEFDINFCRIKSENCLITDPVSLDRCVVCIEEYYLEEIDELGVDIKHCVQMNELCLGTE